MHKSGGKKRKKHIFKRNPIAALFEFPEESVSNSPVFHIVGENGMEICGCDGILEYTENKIVLSAGHDRFTVVGKNLLLSDFRGNNLCVRGEIQSASFGGGDEKC